MATQRKKAHRLKDCTVTMMVTPMQKKRLQAGAERYGQALAPWLLGLGLREAAGAFDQQLGQAFKRSPHVDTAKKTGYFFIRMTAEQKQTILARCSHLGVPLSTWLLFLGLLECEHM